jgi:hypothetical protein
LRFLVDLPRQAQWLVGLNAHGQVRGPIHTHLPFTELNNLLFVEIDAAFFDGGFAKEFFHWGVCACRQTNNKKTCSNDFVFVDARFKTNGSHIDL